MVTAGTIANAGLAHPARRLEVLNDVDLDSRGLIDAQHLIAIEVCLLDTAVLQSDLAVKRRCYAEDDRTLNLRLYRVGIDHSAAIDSADDAPDADRSVLRYFDFGYLRHIIREGELDGNATANSFRQRPSPTGLFGG